MFKECQPNEKACKNGKCIQKIWLCDGEKDCDDGGDEEFCCNINKCCSYGRLDSNKFDLLKTCQAPTKPGELCKSFEFSCKSRRQCVFKSFVCDKENDCADGSDEIGCGNLIFGWFSVYFYLDTINFIFFTRAKVLFTISALSW
jgi:hypothetical protein